jgi:thymidine kinase
MDHRRNELAETGRSNDGRIELILGPMFSGKSTCLQMRVRRHQISKRRCLLIKYVEDTRYSRDHVATHDLQMMDAVPCKSLSEIFGNIPIDGDELKDFAGNPIIREYDVIGIDEGQFYPDIVEWAQLLASMGKEIIIAALDGTFQMKQFGCVLQLIPMSEDVTKLTAVCMMCHKDASFSKRITESSEVVDIGGSEKYIACCRKCYYTN